ncbi:MAG: ankyrin repeat domain-containing protein [Synergistaceae bacterium]|nr:ankyrin repeat domain-containing protein [Synergistaceae bacterium]
MRKILGAATMLLLASVSCGAENINVYMLARTASPSELEEAVKAGANFNVSRDLSGEDYDKYGDGEIIYGFGGTPLHDAASFNHNPESVKYLVSLGLDVNAEGEEGLGSIGTPLTCAVNSKNFPAVKALLEAGANPNYSEIVWFWCGTPFHTAAAWYKNPEEAGKVIGWLAEAGGDVNVHGEFTDEERYDVLEPLYSSGESSALLKGGRFDAEAPFRLDDAHLSRVGFLNAASSCTPLIYAVLYDNPAAVDALLDFGADAKIRNIEGRTALDYARQLPAKSRLKRSPAWKRLKEASRD